MGGSGSGNFGHAGRPGLVGGSGSGAGLVGGSGSGEGSRPKPSGPGKTLSSEAKKTLATLADKIKDQTHETMYIIDIKTGEILYTEQGTEDEVGMELLEKESEHEDQPSIQENQVVLHNHPVDTSTKGVDAANKPPSFQDLGSFLNGGSRVFAVVGKDDLFFLEKPAKGFTEKQKSSIDALMKKHLYDSETKSPRYPTDADWRWLAKAVPGLKYSKNQRTP